MNIIKFPSINKFNPLKSNVQIPSSINGYVSNGFNEIFIDINTNATNKVEVAFDINVYSIDNDTFDKWKLQISKILDVKVISDIENKIILESNEDKEIAFYQYMSMYSLLVFEYAYKSNLNIDHYINHSMIPFDTNQCVQEQGRQVIESIYKLESSIINFKGTMVATEIYKNPRVFIPVSYFQFWDDKIVSFASYKVHKSIAGHL